MENRNLSPLRYPGGKNSLAGFLEEVLYANNLQGGTYIEPFAGGAGSALKLLAGGHVDKIIINDRDPAIYSFWKCAMSESEEFVERINSVPLNVKEWRRQRLIYSNPRSAKVFELGFSAFYLNRCNRSGIIVKAGPIGGMDQTGNYLIDARFNRKELARRVSEIAAYGDRIKAVNEDALRLIQNLDSFCSSERRFIYADPPYYLKGSILYLNFYEDSDHLVFSQTIRNQGNLSWLVTYDDVPRIRELYSDMAVEAYNLRYSAHLSSKSGGELVITPKHLVVPEKALQLLRMKNRESVVQNN